jgi:hypothetical protein
LVGIKTEITFVRIINANKQKITYILVISSSSNVSKTIIKISENLAINI